MIKLIGPFRGIFFFCLFLTVSLSILGPIRPHIIQLTVDDAILGSDMPLLIKMAGILLVILILQAIFRYLFIYFSNWLGQSIIKNLRDRVFNHVLKLRLRYFDTTPIGTSTTRTINDVEAINDTFSQGFITILSDLLTIIVVLSIMFSKDWQLSLMCLCTFPIFIYATYLFKEGVKKAFQGVRTQVARLNAFTQERISGMQIVQIFSAENKEFEKFKAINEEFKKANLSAVWSYSVFFPVLEIIKASALGLLVWFGANQVLDHQSSIGILMAFILYLEMLFRPLRMIADRFNTLQMGIVASERVFAVLDQDEFIDNEGTIIQDDIKGAIDFQNVSFAYNEVDMVLKNVSFQIDAGNILAIVGPTGAGKSSLINILNRFYEIQEGAIKIDGLNIKEFDLYDLRKKIGLVLQDVFLFSGSIHNNITLNSPEISREDVIKAAKLVGAHEFINRLPGGYDYKVMERGATLSHGQRQLISFIRAMVHDPKILILDEATSSIDTETEELIQKATEVITKGRTSIVIAHRLSTIKNADKIMVLQKGEVVEIGTHHELLLLDGKYKELHDMQFLKNLNKSA